MHRGANPSSAMSAATPGAFARATIQPPEMKTQSPSGSRGRAGIRISNLPPWLSLLCMVIYIKEEPTIQVSVSSTLTVYHDGQFWVGLGEHVEDGRYGVARIVFGAEPSNEEILQFVVNKWAKLSFFGHDSTEASKPAKNPKRRAREAAKAETQAEATRALIGDKSWREQGYVPCSRMASIGFMLALPQRSQQCKHGYLTGHEAAKACPEIAK